LLLVHRGYCQHKESVMAMTPEEIMRLKIERGWKPAPEPRLVGLVPGQENAAMPVNREDKAVVAALESEAAVMGLRGEDLTDAQVARVAASVPKAEPEPTPEPELDPETEAEPEPKAAGKKK